MKTAREFSRAVSVSHCELESMIPKKPAPDLIRGGHRFSEKIMLQQ
jgi:hypothetical protein